MSTQIRHDWKKEEIQAIYDQPLLELVYQAATVHREFHKPSEIQVSTLLSIKTGGCPEDCSYCGQAARYHTDIKVQALLPTEKVLNMRKKQKMAVLLVFVWLPLGVKFEIIKILIALSKW